MSGHGPGGWQGGGVQPGRSGRGPARNHVDTRYFFSGLVGNLPTDVVRAKGADIVIGVHLEVAPAKASDIQSLVSVLGRSIDVIIRDNEIRGRAGADLIVRVDLHDFSSMDYEKSKAIINRRMNATATKANVLTPYSLTDF